MNDNGDDYVVIPRDPHAVHIGCVFCGRSKHSNPELEVVTDGRSGICSSCVDAALFLINNADRPMLSDWLRTLRSPKDDADRDR